MHVKKLLQLRPNKQVDNYFDFCAAIFDLNRTNQCRRHCTTIGCPCQPQRAYIQEEHMDTYASGMDTDDGHSNASNGISNAVNVSQYDFMFGKHMETYNVEVWNICTRICCIY